MNFNWNWPLNSCRRRKEEEKNYQWRLYDCCDCVRFFPFVFFSVRFLLWFKLCHIIVHFRYLFKQIDTTCIFKAPYCAAQATAIPNNFLLMEAVFCSLILPSYLMIISSDECETHAVQLASSQKSLI